MIEALALEVVPADELRFIFRQLADRLRDDGHELGVSERLLGTCFGGHRNSIAFVSERGLRKQTDRHGRRHGRQVLAEGAFRVGRSRSWRRRREGVFCGALADERRRAERSQTLVRATR